MGVEGGGIKDAFQVTVGLLIQGSETSANYNLTPGKYPEENIQYSNHGESLKSRIIMYIALKQH